ncbi:MAG TPA: alpha/beta hydrolase [Longimicrobiales bacterium]
MRSSHRRLLLALAAAAAAAPARAQTPDAPARGAPAASVAGDWMGTLEVPGGRLRIVFHITAGADGLAATLDSPDQGAYGIATGAVVLDGDSLTIAVPAIMGRYAGVLRGDTIAGTWSQGPASLPLALARADGAATGPNRPQHPEPPYPYDAIDVSFANEEAGITLAGTLTRPKGDGPFPAVVLISGSGPQDRDETIFAHKPFLVLADYLTRRGIAVLRYDDRGIGGSTGDFAAATTADFASDARAAVRFLRARDDIDAERIGLLGHSEGGVVAPIAANGSDDVAFVVLLAAPGIPLDELIPIQAERIARAASAEDSVISRMRAGNERLFAILRETPEPEAAAERLRAALRAMVDSLPPAERAAMGGSEQAIEAAITQQVAALTSPWMRFLVGYDPTNDLRRLNIPVLALNGELDLQVPPDVNLPPIERALREGGNPDAEVHVLPGLNHLFQPARTGAPTEYGTIETTIAPEALERIGDWIERRVRARD